MDNVKNDAYYVQKIQTDMDFISEKMKGVSQKDLESNEILSDSMHFRLIQIEENAKKLSDEFKAAHPAVPWADIAGLRNRIVHDYGNVDLNVVYQTLSEDIPSLREMLR